MKNQKNNIIVFYNPPHLVEETFEINRSDFCALEQIRGKYKSKSNKMKTYRLKKWYPSLPERLKSGCSIFLEDGEHFVALEWENYFLTRAELECEEYWEDITPKECTCNSPMLQEETRECGRCGKYIDKEKHIILTERYRLIDEYLKDRVFLKAENEDIAYYINKWENFKANQDA